MAADVKAARLTDIVPSTSGQRSRRWGRRPAQSRCHCRVNRKDEHRVLRARAIVKESHAGRTLSVSGGSRSADYAMRQPSDT